MITLRAVLAPRTPKSSRHFIRNTSRVPVNREAAQLSREGRSATQASPPRVGDATRFVAPRRGLKSASPPSAHAPTSREREVRPCYTSRVREVAIDRSAPGWHPVRDEAISRLSCHAKRRQVLREVEEPRRRVELWPPRPRVTTQRLRAVPMAPTAPCIRGGGARHVTGFHGMDASKEFISGSWRTYMKEYLATYRYLVQLSQGARSPARPP